MNPTLVELERIINMEATNKAKVEQWTEAFRIELERVINEYHPSRGEVRLAKIILKQIEE